HALVVSSGTASLHLAVLALGLGPGDEVLVPAYTFPATANVVAHVGAKPVLVDVDPRTMSLDPERTGAAVTPRTRAVIAVHLFGRPLDWEALPDEVELVEDAAGALGSRSCCKRASGLRPRTPIGSRASSSSRPPTRATATAGRRTLCSSTGGTRPSRRCASRRSRHRSARMPSTASRHTATRARS